MHFLYMYSGLRLRCLVSLTQADEKIADTSNWRFTNQLAREISWFQPLYITNGTQVGAAGLSSTLFCPSVCIVNAVLPATFTCSTGLLVWPRQLWCSSELTCVCLTLDPSSLSEDDSWCVC
jgi:hypothetical protein